MFIAKKYSLAVKYLAELPLGVVCKSNNQLWLTYLVKLCNDIHKNIAYKMTTFKAAYSVTFDFLILELMFLFFKNTVKN